MKAVLDYLIQNWALILVLLAFVIMLSITVFLSKKTVRRMFLLIAAVFILSILVFYEFRLSETNELPKVRTVLIAIRYSSTPIIIALILFALVKRAKWYVLIPAFVFAIINIISIFTGIVFSLDSEGNLVRGFLGYLPYVGVGLYCIFLVYILIKESNKQASEIISIGFLAFSFASGLIFPFIFKKDYSKIFCTTIAVALFVYYVFLILQLTKKDALTGLLNRQAYYASIRDNNKDITAFVSIDMNQLKVINDLQGHLAGDQALLSIARCLTDAVKSKQLIYRIGGDEFVIICRKTSKEELDSLIENIRKNVGKTEYSCSIGFSFNEDGSKNHTEMIKESDEMMYKDKADFYSKEGNDRRVY